MEHSTAIAVTFFTAILLTIHLTSRPIMSPQDNLWVNSCLRESVRRTRATNPPAITEDGIYKMVKYYAKRVGVNIEGFGAHSLRATAATNALDHEADIAKVQE
jgi:integrase